MIMTLPKGDVVDGQPFTLRRIGADEPQVWDLSTPNLTAVPMAAVGGTVTDCAEEMKNSGSAEAKYRSFQFMARVTWNSGHQGLASKSYPEGRVCGNDIER